MVNSELSGRATVFSTPIANSSISLSPSTITTFDIVIANTIATLSPLSLPPDKVIYSILEAAKAALQNHARDNGYGISISHLETRGLHMAVLKEANTGIPKIQKPISQNNEKTQVQ
jgi:hypothetical protein